MKKRLAVKIWLGGERWSNHFKAVSPHQTTTPINFLPSKSIQDFNWKFIEKLQHFAKTLPLTELEKNISSDTDSSSLG